MLPCTRSRPRPLCRVLQTYLLLLGPLLALFFLCVICNNMPSVSSISVLYNQCPGDTAVKMWTLGTLSQICLMFLLAQCLAHRFEPSSVSTQYTWVYYLFNQRGMNEGSWNHWQGTAAPTSLQELLGARVSGRVVKTRTEWNTAT